MREPGARRAQQPGEHLLEAILESLKRPPPTVRGPLPDARARIHVPFARGNLICFRHFFQPRDQINGTAFILTENPMSHLVRKIPARRTLTSDEQTANVSSATGAEEFYWPASNLAVIRPTLSITEPRMISMARATSPNSTSLSPLTKAIFSARSLKICSMRGPRLSQVESSLLILTLPLVSTCTTTVLFSSSTSCFWFGFG